MTKQEQTIINRMQFFADCELARQELTAARKAYVTDIDVRLRVLKRAHEEVTKGRHPSELSEQAKGTHRAPLAGIDMPAAAALTYARELARQIMAEERKQARLCANIPK